MKYIGNYQFPNLRQQVIESIGKARPRDWPASTAIESAEYRKCQEAGYDLNAVNWWIFEKDDLDINLEFPWTNGNCHWWITKLYPGQFMPIHTDPPTHYSKCKRYWVPLQDYEHGHIFIYDNNIVKDYSAGDVYEYLNSSDYHGAANIGHTVRVVLQVTEFLV